MATQLSVSVIEDHDLLRESTVAMLQEHGLNAVGWDCAEAINVSAPPGQPMLHIIDLNLPGESGLELARRLRQAQPTAGIVMVTARSDISDRVEGYRSGADVYMVKPVEPDELLAVVRAMEARLIPALSKSDCLLECASLTLKASLGEAQLTYSEVSLLVGFAAAQDRTLSREEVAKHLNLTCEPRHSASMNVRLSQLRKKLRVVGVKEPSIKSLRERGLKMCFKLVAE